MDIATILGLLLFVVGIIAFLGICAYIDETHEHRMTLRRIRHRQAVWRAHRQRR